MHAVGVPYLALEKAATIDTLARSQLILDKLFDFLHRPRLARSRDRGRWMLGRKPVERQGWSLRRQPDAVHQVKVAPRARPVRQLEASDQNCQGMAPVIRTPCPHRPSTRMEQTPCRIVLHEDFHVGMPRVTPDLLIKRRQIVVGAFQNLGEAILVEGQGAPQACLRITCSRRRHDLADLGLDVRPGALEKAAAAIDDPKSLLTRRHCRPSLSRVD